MRILKNTDKIFNCVQCGAETSNIVREDPKGTNPRLKCTGCNFLFDAQDAEAAKEAGAIPVSSPETLAKAVDPEVEIHSSSGNKTIAVPEFENHTPSEEMGMFTVNKIPRTPTYVFIAKDKSRVEFCTSKEVKKLALKWEQGGSYDVYELNPKQFDVKVDIS